MKINFFIVYKLIKNAWKVFSINPESIPDLIKTSRIHINSKYIPVLDFFCTLLYFIFCTLLEMILLN